MTESSATSMVANYGSLDISVLRGYLKGIGFLKEIDLHHPSTSLNFLHFRWEGAVGQAIVVSGGSPDHFDPERVNECYEFAKLEANRPISKDDFRRLANNVEISTTRLKGASQAEKGIYAQQLAEANLILRQAIKKSTSVLECKSELRAARR